MADLAKDLVNAIQKAFTRKAKTDTVIAGIRKELEREGVSYREAEEYAARIGELLSQAMQEIITPDGLPGGKMAAELAEEILRPLLRQNYEEAARVAAQVQNSLNRHAGLGLKALQPSPNENRATGLINKISSYDSYEKAEWLTGEPVVNYTQSAVEDTIRTNADAHFKAGLSPKIKRIATGNCCKWCRSLAGTYDYPVPREIYRRHENCRCLVLYDPGDGKVQNAHTKATYRSQQEAEREYRINLVKQFEQKQQAEETLNRIVRNPETLADGTPEEWEKAFERAGLTVSPLKKGQLKDIPFEQGGGWKVNFGDGGIIQYHPEEKSHHQGAYYKISTGRGGKHWYNLEGKEIDVKTSGKAGKQIIS